MPDLKSSSYNRRRALHRLSDALRDLASADSFMRRAESPSWMTGQLWEVVEKLRALRMAVEETPSVVR